MLPQVAKIWCTCSSCSAITLLLVWYCFTFFRTAAGSVHLLFMVLNLFWCCCCWSSYEWPAAAAVVWSLILFDAGWDSHLLCYFWLFLVFVVCVDLYFEPPVFGCFFTLFIFFQCFIGSIFFVSFIGSFSLLFSYPNPCINIMVLGFSPSIDVPLSSF